MKKLLSLAPVLLLSLGLQGQATAVDKAAPGTAKPDKTSSDKNKAGSDKTGKSAKDQKQTGSSVNLLGHHNSNAPINVSSDNFVGDMATKIGTYIGNVIAIQGDMKLRSDTMKVHVNQGKPTRIEAFGRVVVNAPNGTATGDTGIYELGPRTITMTGHVVLTKEKDVMRGTKLVMDLNTNLAHLYAQGMPGGRVQGLFIPPPQKPATDAKKTAPAKGKRIHDTIETSGDEKNPSPAPQK